MPAAFKSVHLDDVPGAPPGWDDRVRWLPVRHYLQIGAFGTNAFSADAGAVVIEPHDELGGDEGIELDQEEMYVVVRGGARFVVDGTTIDAPHGTVVFVPEPSARREATATEDGTLILAVGAPVGEAFRQSQWEKRGVAEHRVPTFDDA
jgi:hypothetical protein